MYQTTCRSRFCLRMMMPYNIQFTNRVTWSILEMQSPHFNAQPSQAQAIRKRSGLVFLCMDQVTRLVNR